jgi:hypothetical protein
VEDSRVSLRCDDIVSNVREGVRREGANITDVSTFSAAKSSSSYKRIIKPDATKIA